MQDQKEMNPIWLAHSRLRRRKFDDCIDVCTSVLNCNPYDQAVWYLKTRALTLKQWIDDSELEEEGIAGAAASRGPLLLLQTFYVNSWFIACSRPFLDLTLLQRTALLLGRSPCCFVLHPRLMAACLSMPLHTKMS